MQRIMCTAILGLSVALGGCQSEPEEAPDITEAIPVDPQADDAARPSGDEANTGADSTPVPGEPEPPALPLSMESGSNPPEMTAPPSGAKVQPAG